LKQFLGRINLTKENVCLKPSAKLVEMTKIPLKTLLVCSALISGCSSKTAIADVSITSGFPGGNALVTNKGANTFQIAPDLRGGQNWFYWYFEAQSSQSETATFVFSPTNVGVRGPAYSIDNGKTWTWMGADKVENLPPAQPGAKVTEAKFTYKFNKAGEKVRFSVGIPYVQSHLESFLAKYPKNQHLVRSVLTKSKKGRDVELIQIGTPGPNKQALLLTARSHACEALANYALEGFMEEAISDSYAGKLFRDKYVLYAVPFLDKDGVEDGDQGKNRAPHDHNRDYGDNPIYPEIAAVQKLADEKKIFHSMDLHCPYLKGDIHEAFHFLGLGVPHIKDNAVEWSNWMSEERPPAVMTPLMFLADPAKPGVLNRAINSHYFATRDGAYFSATLEIPYTQQSVALDGDMTRSYGRSMLKAWNRSTFISKDPNSNRTGNAYEELVKWRKAYQALSRPKPTEAKAMAQLILDNPNASPVYRAEALLGLAHTNLFQQQFPQALENANAVLKMESAMNSQFVSALTYRVQALARANDTEPKAIEAAVAEAFKVPYLSPAQQYQISGFLVDYYEKNKNYNEAIRAARTNYQYAADHFKGRVLNRIAGFYTLQNQPDEAVKVRREAVALLKEQIGEKPVRNVFGATMVIEYFDAIMAIPTSTLAEKRAAADQALNHDIVAPMYKDRITKEIAAVTGAQ
jgi:hypothetical protein